MKKKIAIIVGAIFSFFVIGCVSLLIFYNSSLGSVETNKDQIETINFVVEQGSTTNQIIDSLYENKLIKNKYTAYIFVKLTSYILIIKCFENVDVKVVKAKLDSKGNKINQYF